MSGAPPVFRFAPSPNGELHLGHAFSALFTSAAARAAGGRFLLRIEDIDIDRSRPEYEKAIYEDLAWLGIEWEEPVRRQSQHFADYRKALNRLQAMGLVYPCFASRSEIAAAAQSHGAAAPRDPDGALIYPGIWRGRPARDVNAMLARGASFALRLDMAGAVTAAKRHGAWPLRFDEAGAGPAGETGSLAADPGIWGDVILARKDAPASYHLAVVTDDALQGVTHVTRGQDLFYATYVHRLLQTLLELPQPRYQHHRLILDASGRKLAKSLGDTSLRALREAGETPAGIRASLGF